MKELTPTASVSLFCCRDITNKGLVVVLATKELNEGPRHRLAFTLTVLFQSSFCIK